MYLCLLFIVVFFAACAKKKAIPEKKKIQQKQQNAKPKPNTTYCDISHLSSILKQHHYLVVNELKPDFLSLVPLHLAFEPGRPNDWYASHPEPGQPFSQYIKQKPVRPGSGWTTIYIQMLGDFTDKEKKVVERSAEFISHYFQLPVKFTKPYGLDKIPSSAKRVHWGFEQIHTTYVLDKLLKPNRPKDAVAYIAFTSSDLYPEESWNFVYGQASLRQRTGVWSIYRNGKVDGNKEERFLFLLRTMKTATHELGHIFTLRHCVAFNCNMNGVNNRDESDTKPLWLCPNCLQKLQWSIGFSITRRYQKLAEFCKTHGLDIEERLYRESLAKR